MQPTSAGALTTLTMSELQRRLSSSAAGLTQAEAGRRLRQYGANEIAAQRSSAVLKFLGHFRGPVPWMIEAAAILSAVARHWPDVGIILVLLCANAVVGCWGQRQANNAIEALKKRLASNARVLRDGSWSNPAARQVVPGDVIRLRLGDIVPADARLLEGEPIQVDESALTGQSLPATRQPGDAVYSGSIMRRGECAALVYATGEDTCFGRTAQEVPQAPAVGHFQQAMLRIGNYLSVLTAALVTLILAGALYRGDPIPTTLQFALVLAVAATPVALSTVLAVTLSVGARLLAKKDAIVSRLVAIEELAGLDVLCVDETATLKDSRAAIATALKMGVQVRILDPGSLGDLQQRGHIVGVAGDGLHDAAALKQADCGIAVAGATDAARAAAAIVLVTPGLSVIIDAIRQSRKVFQRLHSYAIYRIAETLRLLLFMTIAILAFNFYPLTAVMIVMLALLNDGAILSIAYDHVRYRDQPAAWNLRLVLGIATVLGVFGVLSAFGLCYLAEREFHVDHVHAQTMLYLQLSVAGQLTIFLTRTRGPFWSVSPARALWVAVLGTQAVATLCAVYGFLMTPVGWEWAGFVWGYALVWFVINDRIKLLAYRIFDPPARPTLGEVVQDWLAAERPIEQEPR